MLSVLQIHTLHLKYLVIPQINEVDHFICVLQDKDVALCLSRYFQVKCVRILVDLTVFL